MQRPPFTKMELFFTEHMRAQPTCILLLSSLGLLSLLRVCINLLRWAHAAFFRPPKDLRKAYGTWALVTGATDGIGKAFAFRLAGTGLNLVLVGRSPDKLREVSAAIRAESWCTQVRTVVFDFSGDLSGGMRRLEGAIGGLDVGVLVNSAGATHPNAAYFHEVGGGAWADIVRVNVEGTTMVTQAVVKGMLERRRGAVLSIGSGASAALPSYPLYAVYAATKAYIDQLSRSLYVEYKDMGIDVQCQIPLFVATKMVPWKRTSSFVPTPDDYAGAAVRWIGYEPRCTPYWPHFVQWSLASLVPDFILNSWRLQIPLFVATKMVPWKRTSSFVPTPDDYAGAAVRWIGYEPRCTPYWPHFVQWSLASLVPDFILNSWRLQVGISRRSQMKGWRKE